MGRVQCTAWAASIRGSIKDSVMGSIQGNMELVAESSRCQGEVVRKGP